MKLKILCVLVCAVALAGTARAADIVNNLSASTSQGWDMSLSGDGQAQSFQNGPSAMSFTNLSLVLMNNSGPSSTVAVQLRADSGGSPGAIIETVTNAFLFVNGFPTTYDIPAKGTNLLAAGTKYWIALIWVSGDSSWRYTTTTNSTGSGTLLDADAYTENGGGSWSAGNPSEVFKMAVRGAQVPVTRYVSLTGSHTPPFTTWATAATNIQAAVDAAGLLDTVLVTNGTYQTGGRTIPSQPLLTNRLVLDKPIPVRSVNGPALTIIKGAGPVGNDAIRCAYLTNGASLSGFTLTNGATRPNAGNSADENGGGVYSETGGTLSNCLLTGNSAGNGGGGAYDGTLNNCTLSGNSAGTDGGGAYQSTLNNCTLSGNSAAGSGGGAFFGTLNNCTISGNAAFLYGGGADSCTLENCIVYFNTAASGSNYSGGISFTYSCTAPLPGGTGNTAADPLFENRLAGNFRLTANSPCRNTGNNANAPGSTDLDGNPRIVNGTVDMGAYEFITAPGDGFIIPSSIASSTFATDLYPATNLINGSGLSGAPTFTNTATHVAAASSNAWVTTGNFPNSYYPAFPIPVFTNTLPGTNVYALSEFVIWGYHFGASASGNEAKTFDLTFSLDGTNYAQSTVVTSATPFVTNGLRLPFPAVRLARFVRVAITTNHYPVNGGGDRVGLGELRFIGQIQNPVAVTRFVSLTGSHTHPFTSWATAATNIQDAVDAASLLDTVLVTNGTYQTGGRVMPGWSLTNRLVLDKPIPVRSVNGPALTIIKGAGPNGPAAIRCAYLTNGASLSGFTLTNGATRGAGFLPEVVGGGVYSETGGTLSNCLLTGNSAVNGGGAYDGTLNNCTISGNSAGTDGGGAYFGTLNNCTISGNSAGNGGGAYDVKLNNCTISGNSAGNGGGAYRGTQNNCTLTGNSAGIGGGAYEGTLNNCIVYFNTATSQSNFFLSTFNYSCTAPHPGGTGNITNAPLFENLAAGNFRLTANSPCRNTGNNAAATGATDLDGNARTNGATVDMGAYEFTDTDTDGLPNWWETLHGLNPAASNTPAANADADGNTDWEEYIADTNPTNPASYFPRIALTNPPPGFQSLVISNTSPGRIYFTLGTTNLIAPQTWTLIPPELPGTGTNLVLTIPATNTIRAHCTGVRLP